MNLLAHALLTPPGDDDLLVGNLTADWIKGRARLAFPQLLSGFALHRYIDAFADTHPAMLRAVGALEPRWNRYAPVLADVLFDHVLAASWPHPTPLPAFTGQIYGCLRAALPTLPPRAQHAACAMIADDWLTAYASLDGIRLALTRMSARLAHGIELAPAVETFLEHQRLFAAAFHELLPALAGHLATLLPHRRTA